MRALSIVMSLCVQDTLHQWPSPVWSWLDSCRPLSADIVIAPTAPSKNLDNVTFPPNSLSGLFPDR